MSEVITNYATAVHRGERYRLTWARTKGPAVSPSDLGERLAQRSGLVIQGAHDSGNDVAPYVTVWIAADSPSLSGLVGLPFLLTGGTEFIIAKIERLMLSVPGPLLSLAAAAQSMTEGAKDAAYSAGQAATHAAWSLERIALVAVAVLVAGLLVVRRLS